MQGLIGREGPVLVNHSCTDERIREKGHCEGMYSNRLGFISPQKFPEGKLSMWVTSGWCYLDDIPRSDRNRSHNLLLIRYQREGGRHRELLGNGDGSRDVLQRSELGRWRVHKNDSSRHAR